MFTALRGVDPSLTLGFYCDGPGDFARLRAQLAELEVERARFPQLLLQVNFRMRRKNRLTHLSCWTTSNSQAELGAVNMPFTVEDRSPNTDEMGDVGLSGTTTSEDPVCASDDDEEDIDHGDSPTKPGSPLDHEGSEEDEFVLL